MTTVVSSHVVPNDRVESILRARDDALVAERQVEPGRFELVEGPFRRWTRTVEVTPVDDDHSRVDQRMRFAVAMPVWGIVGGPAIARMVRRHAVDEHVTPWWLPPDRLSARAADVVSRCCLLAVLGGFVGGLVGQTITFIGTDLHFRVDAQSRALAIIRLGALLTMAGLALADRRGRRPLILWTGIGAAVASTLGALAPDLAWVTASQLACRGLVAISVLLLPILAAEEVPAGSRALTVGVITMSGGLGVGMVLWVLPLADVSTSAWRWIWALSVLAIPATWAVCRGLPESRRFEARAARSATTQAGPAIWNRRLVLFGLIVTLLYFFVTPVQQLQNEFLRHARGFSATRITLFVIGTNTWGGIGVIVGGWIADRRSRHSVAVIALVGLAVGNAAMFAWHGWSMWVASAVGSVIGAATIPSLGVMYPELFDTSGRGTASGILNIAAVVGGALGLAIAGPLIDQRGYGLTFAVLAVAPIVAAVVMKALPETARRELEDISGPNSD